MLGTLPPLKGNAYYCWHLSDALAKKIDVEFFSFSKLYPEFLYPGGTLDKDDMFIARDTERLKIHRDISIYNPLSWFRAGMRARGDLVHAQFWSLPVVPVWLAAFSRIKSRNKKILLTVHNLVQHESTFYEEALVKRLIRQADEFVVHAAKNVAEMESLFGVPQEKVHHIPMGPHGVLSENGAVAMTPEQARKKLGIDPDARVLLFFGNIREYKGVDDFIRTIALLKEKYAGKVIGLIAGQPWKNARELDEIIRENGVAEQVVAHLKYIPAGELRTYFTATDVVLLPYKKMDGQTGVGNVALDYHKPMVVTEVGGLPELVLREECVVPPNRPDRLAEQTLKILTDEKLAAALAEDSRKLVQSNSWDAISDKTIAVYEAMLAKA